MQNTKPFYKRLRDDDGYDEIRLVNLDGTPIFRCITRYRYKTSGLSGDEWRVSTIWQIAEMPQKWTDFHGAFHNLEVACMAFYPGIFTDHKNKWKWFIRSVDYYRKGNKIYQMTYEGDALPLIHVAGHLPWALIKAREDGYHRPDDDDEYCFQPGCAEKAISTYRLKYTCCRDGHKSDPPFPDTRVRFCKIHLQRGDCGLEDADDNYEVIEGPGPNQAEGWGKYESESIYGGTISI